MTATLRYYSGPLLLAVLLHLAAGFALHSGWSPEKRSAALELKPRAIQSRLVMVRQKAAPAPRVLPPAEAPPQPEPRVAAQPKPAPPPEPVEPSVDEQALRAQEVQRRLAALAERSFAEAMQTEVTEITEDAEQSEVESYRYGVYERVVANWSRPPSARNGMQARLLVELVPTGTVVSVTLLESSGHAPFDRSAEAAVRKARSFDVPSESRLFERHFRRFSLLFRPEDLLR